MENEQALLLEHFEKFIQNQVKIPEKERPFYVLWVRRYHYFLQSSDKTPLTQRLQKFVEFLRRLDRFADWQINQAIDVISYYEDVFLPQYHQTTPTTGPANWESAITQLKEMVRLRHYTRSTERLYSSWCWQFAKFVHPKNPQQVNSSDAKRFLSYLAITRKVSASTQNQAFNALLFLFRHILRSEYTDLGDTPRAQEKKKLPVVLTQQEVSILLQQLSGTHLLIAKMIYGCGFRVMECLRLRMKDIDFETSTITIRQAKEKKTASPSCPKASGMTCARIW